MRGSGPCKPRLLKPLGMICSGTGGSSGGTGGFTSAVLIDPARARAVVMLASCGGTWPLERAAFLALTGGDPREARPQPPGPEWDDRLSGQIAGLEFPPPRDEDT